MTTPAERPTMPDKGHCACKFSSGGVLSKECTFHEGVRKHLETKLAAANERLNAKVPEVEDAILSVEISTLHDGWVEVVYADLARDLSRRLVELQAGFDGLVAHNAEIAESWKAAESKLASAVAAEKDAARYRWLRDVNVPPHNFYLSVPDEFKDDRYTPEQVDAAIDAARAAIRGSEREGGGNG